MSDIAIKVTNLVRSFEKFTAIKGLSFEVKKGSVCGFVGANGAGKTTTMRILSTLDYATSGEVEVGGYDVMSEPQKVRQLLGWMPDHFGHYDNMTVLDYIDFYARSYGYEGAEREARVREVMEFTDLIEIQDRLSNKLSKGMTQRLSLSRTMLHDPEVLILDEPAAGLDPKARVELKNLLRILADEGKTILISSHILSELGEMCDTMLFELIGTGKDLESWAITTPNAEMVDKSNNGGRIRIPEHEKSEIAADTLKSMIQSGLRVREFRREQQNLESAFMAVLDETNENQKSN